MSSSPRTLELRASRWKGSFVCLEAHELSMSKCAVGGCPVPQCILTVSKRTACVVLTVEVKMLG